MTGHRVGLRREGTLAVAYDAGDYAALTRLTAFRRSAGLEAEELDSRACRKLESFLTPDVHGGVLFPGTGRSTTGGTRRRCVRAAAAAGVRVVRDRVTAVLTADGADGARRPRCAVSRWRKAARSAPTGSRWPLGSWSGAVHGLPAGLRSAVRPVKGQLLRLRHPDGMPPVLTHTIRPRCAARTSTWCRGPTAR